LTTFSTLFSGTSASENEAVDNYGDLSLSAVIQGQRCFLFSTGVVDKGINQAGSGALTGPFLQASGMFHVKHFFKFADFDPSPRLR
jgi:hypothetical protein